MEMDRWENVKDRRRRLRLSKVRGNNGKLSCDDKCYSADNRIQKYKNEYYSVTLEKWWRGVEYHWLSQGVNIPQSVNLLRDQWILQKWLITELFLSLLIYETLTVRMFQLQI
jgi:hypothetical protein